MINENHCVIVGVLLNDIIHMFTFNFISLRIIFNFGASTTTIIIIVFFFFAQRSTFDHNLITIHSTEKTTEFALFCVE